MSTRKKPITEEQREKQRAACRRWREKYPEKHRAAVDRWRRTEAGAKKQKECFRRNRLRRNFGLTVADFDRMFADQGGVCAICKEPETRSRWYTLAVDHCHKTGRVRGLLCNRCNAAIGMLRDRPELAVAAGEYLRCR